MIYELRRYDINPDNWNGYRTWCEEYAFPLFHGRFNLPTVGFFEVMPVERTDDAYTSTIGVRWVLSWDSIEERDKRWAEVAATDAYTTMVQAARDAQGNPLFHLHGDVTLLKAWPESPMQ